MADTVTLTLKAYNDLRDENFELRKENEELANAMETLQKKYGQMVIVREKEYYEDEDGDECVCESTHVKCFDEVKSEVEDFYKEKIEDLKKERDATLQAEKELYEKKLELEMKLSRLTNRGLWARIRNKLVE